MYNTTYDVFQGCTERGWYAFHDAQTCRNGPIGTPCADGTVYAGLSPDGGFAMYTTPADAGIFSWNDSTNNWLDTAMVNCSVAEVSCNTGEANTALLVGLGSTPSPAPYVAARHCGNMFAHGHSDWYLPALNELIILYSNRVNIGGFGTGSYWSSSELTNTAAKAVNFSTGSSGGGINKTADFNVRCVRR